MTRRRLRSLTHLGGNVVPVLSGLATAPLTARALGVEGRGGLTIVLLVSGILVVIGSMGFGWVARHDIGRDPSSTYEWLSIARWFDVSMVPVGAGVAAAISMYLQLDRQQSIATGLLLVLSTCSASRAVRGNALVALGRNAELGRTGLIISLISVVGMVALFFFEMLSLASAIWVSFTSLAVQTVLIRHAVIRALSTGGISNTGGSKIRHSGFMRRSARSAISQTTDLAVCKADALTAGMVGSISQVGLYSTAAIIPQVAYQLVLTAIQQSYVAFPRISRVERLAMVWHSCLFIGLASSLIAFPSAWVLIPVVFGEDFVGAREFIGPACIVVLGLGSICPAVQDSAVSGSPTKISAVLVLGAAGCAAAQLAGAGLGTVVAMIGTGYLFVGVLYVWRVCGARTLLPRLSSFKRLYGIGAAS